MKIGIMSPSFDEMKGKWRNISLLCLAELLAMTLWLSASAVVPQLTEEWNLTGGEQAWLTMSVQIGFVAGALLSTLLNLPDRIPLHFLIGGSAFCGALFNAGIPILDQSLGVALFLRFMTGVALSGVYPPGMKLIATWCTKDRGLGIGLLIGALTIGTGMPHLVNGFSIFGSGGMPPWHIVLLASSVMAGIGAGITAILGRPGPFLSEAAPFSWRFARQALAHRPTRLANFGYLGHMWELYAMWAWAPVLLIASYELAEQSQRMAHIAGFGVIAVGGVGCVLAGILADRLGRTVVAAVSLLVSGACALTAGFFFTSPGILTVICLIWGFSVVADSAQFSAAVSELTDPRYVGTALTLQTCLGFLLTLVTIRLIPLLVERVGWETVFMILAIGPAFGIWSMLRLRSLPEASRMASGNR